MMLCAIAFNRLCSVSVSLTTIICNNEAITYYSAVFKDYKFLL